MNNYVKRSNLPFFIIPAVFLLLACGLGSRLTGDDPTPAPAYQTLIATRPATPTPLDASTPVVSTPAAPQIRNLPIETVVQIWTLDEFDELLWSGSGSIISEDGYILTNAHVILSDKYYDVYGLMVSLTIDDDEPPRPAYLAETIIYDEALDLAVIHIVSDLDGNPLDFATLALPVIELGNSDDLGLGTPLRILGYPGIGGETITLTSGEVAGFTSETGVKGRAYIKTSATIAGGNSGGAGINLLGQLVGIPTQLGYGGDDDIVDCRVLADTNGDGVIDEDDACIPTGGFINALRPINLAKPLIDSAFSGEALAQTTPPPAEPNRSPIDIPENAGQILFKDDFSSDDDTWGIIDNITLDSGQLSLYLPEAGDYIWSTTGGDYESFDYQLDAFKLSGPNDNSFGQIFRFQDADNFYSFEVSSDGFYIVNKLEDGVWSPLIDWTESSLINLDTGVNQITTIAQGNSYTFLVNGVQVGTLRDATFSGGGMGVIASSYSEAMVHIAFDDVLIRVPGGKREMTVPAETTLPDVETVFTDDFSQVDTGWNLSSDEDVERNIVDGELSIRVIADLTDAWSTYDASWGDTIVEVDARKIHGPDENNYGVICRYVDPDNHYFLQLGSDGTYAISRYLDGESTMLVEWTSSETVNQGETPNHIRAECVGNTLSLYANDTLLTSVVDDKLGYGKFALAAGTYEQGDVEIKFDNLFVRSSEAVNTEESSQNLLYYDDFSANNLGWPESRDAESEYYFSDGEYYLNVLESDYLVWAKTADNWEDIKIDVDARQVDGPDDNEYGVMCRYQNADNYYQIGVSGDGYYRIARWLDAEFEELLEWDKNSAINQGAASNHLTVICSGNQISLWVNDKLLANLTDNVLPAGGDIALYVGTFNEGDARIAFDDLLITRP